jgi:hypothetical protein
MQEECENHPLIYDNRSAFAKENGGLIVKTEVISLNDFQSQCAPRLGEKNLITALNSKLQY